MKLDLETGENDKGNFFVVVINVLFTIGQLSVCTGILRCTNMVCTIHIESFYILEGIF